MNNDQENLYSIWLMPQQTNADFFDSMIADLSKRFDTAAFTAHSTLCSGTWQGEISSLVAAVDDIARQLSVPAVDSIGIQHTENRFQFFFLALSSDDLITAQGLAQQLLPGSRLPEVGPHLSLIYSSDSRSIDRHQLSQELQPRMPGVVIFDRLALVLPKNNNWDDIAHWRLEHIIRLAG